MTGRTQASGLGSCTIVGLGLIGGSIARDLRQAGLAAGLTGSDSDAGALQAALELGIIDRAEPDPARAVAAADTVVLAVPVGAMAPVLAAIAGALAPACVVTDVGSTKASVVAAARAALGARLGRFVPGHPVAGTEASGVRASLAGLFAGRLAVLTPLPETDADALTRVTALWQGLGAQVERLPVDAHDRLLAATSHLPHLAAFALVDTLAQRADAGEVFRYAAGGFRDFTRIAASDPALWADIALANREALLAALEHYSARLASLAAALGERDRQALEACFARARQARDELLPDAAERAQ